MIEVLRLGHRAGRDDRISTHVGLTARQWGAEKVYYSGERDQNMMESVEDIVDRWGGELEVEYIEEWKKVIREFDGVSVHLTMYGEKIDGKISEIRENYKGEDVLIVVGSQKVPSWVYDSVDYNISVGNQPHSEIAALAVFMDRCNDGEIKSDFEGADIEVEPSEDRKLTREK